MFGAENPLEGSLSSKQLNYIRDTFAAVSSISGHINRDQFEEVFLKLELKPTLEQIDELWQSMDTTNCGQVDIKDFTRVCGELLIATTFPREGIASSNSTEMADFKRIFGTQIPPWLENDGWPLQSESLGTQLRINCLQTRLSGTGELFRMLIEKISHLEVCRSSLTHEVEALKPCQEKLVEVETELKKEQDKTKSLQRENESLTRDLSVLRRMVIELGGDESSLPAKRSAFTKEQEHILHELQEQVRELSMPDERYCRLEECVEQLTRTNAELIEKCEASESLLQSVLQVNQYLVSRQDDHLKKLQDNQSKLVDAELECSRIQHAQILSSKISQELASRLDLAAVLLSAKFGPVEGSAAGDVERQQDEEEEAETRNGGGGAERVQNSLQRFDEGAESWLAAHQQLGEEEEVKKARALRDKISLVGEVMAARSAIEGYLYSLRVAERNVENLADANSQIMRQLLLHMLNKKEAKESSRERSSEAYTVAREQAELYNSLLTPKVGPGSSTQKMPLWLFKDSGQTSMHQELKGISLPSNRRPAFDSASHESIAKWLQEFRVRMKQASVRFLAAQDSTVLGAELYTKIAFEKLMKRANAITEDMIREAAMLRSGENQNNELAYQLSLLLEETVDTTSRMNSLAAVVHDIMFKRIIKLQESSELESNGLSKDESLVSLASLSGILGEITTSNVEAERMRVMLADIEKAIVDHKLGIDHRANGFLNSRNAGSQLARVQRQVQHNTLFGLMTSRLSDAKAAVTSKE
uniref:EF-hand domain-containing protein n=1 Tax=Guillardia theta TaxID=55529 RepID=A0A7S4NRZ8_GUITH|mmetsp:Transcript_31535/g.100880  ORF Transcript_31535/g.100880 Transcript_31535/m.100880 type:complete len:760 (+) Transcript_31535:88-2367(+)